MKTLDDEGISIDALVNNAGITGPKRRMEEVTAETLEGVMRVNITGVVLMCREAVKRMSKRLLSGSTGCAQTMQHMSLVQSYPFQVVAFKV